MNDQIIRILVSDSAEPGDASARNARFQIEDVLRRNLAALPTRVVEVQTSTLVANVRTAFEQINELISGLPELRPPYVLKEVTFSLGIDSKGEVSLVSTLGSSVTSMVGLTFSISRK